MSSRFLHAMTVLMSLLKLSRLPPSSSLLLRLPPQPMSTGSSSSGTAYTGAVSFAADYDFRDVPIVQETMAVANNFIASQLFAEAPHPTGRQ